MDDNETLHEIDLVVIATGYKLKYPFIDKDLIDFEKDPLEVYRFVFPSNLRYPATMSFVGMIDPEGSVFTTAEMQSRWIARVLTGKARLPNPDRMNYTIRQTGKLLKKWSYHGNRHKTRIFWYFYMEKLADYIGVRPSLLRLLFTDFSLFWVVFTGPLMAYQYRIKGPHLWSGARETLISYETRVNKPLMVGSVNKPNKTKNESLNNGNTKKLVFTFVLAFGVIAVYAMKTNEVW